FCQQKYAQAGFEFLRVTSDARSGALGEAVNSIYGFSGALFHNPASMGEMPGMIDASFSVNKWIADINHLSASLIFSPVKGNYGNFGLSLQSVDYGDVQGTILAPELPDGYIDTQIFNPSALAIGVGYAKMLNDKFSVGGQVRYATQKLGQSEIPYDDEEGNYTKDNEANAWAFDFGTLYRFGIKSLAFGMSVRNFSTDVKYEQEDFQLPLTFTLGISANVFDFVEIEGPEQALLLSIDTAHPLAHPEQVKIGLEYNFVQSFFLRGGYIGGNSQDDFTFGFGVAKFGLELDYAYTPFEWFENVQRITVRYSL
ncbi:MAG: PorV/PorQ family protein, partial [Calditrichaceae bacterium]